MGYRLQAVQKTLEGTEHPDRNAQFEFINDRVEAYQERNAPVISVDTKKKELVGDFANKGREWQPMSEPVPVRVHDFIDKELGKVIPYGVYDLARNEGWVNVGIDHDTPEFAVASIARWWSQMGRKVYEKATELLITAAGGSNAYRSRVFKTELQAFADRTGLTIGVLHFPPGTSKWNKIEHRMFCHITENWRGRPLVDHETIVQLIGATRTTTGLRVRAKLDERAFPKGVEVTDEELAEVNLVREAFHGEWNYTIAPRRRRECTRALPGVHSATVTSERPLSRPENHIAAWAADKAAPRDTEASSRVAVQAVGDDYAKTMGIRLLRGRALDQRDHSGEPSAVMINEVLATRLWPGEDPIGRAMIFGIPNMLDLHNTVVGVVANIKQESLTSAPPPLVYYSLKDREKDRAGHPFHRAPTLFVAVRTDGDPHAVLPGVRRVVAGIDPRIALSEVSTMDDVLWQEVARPRFLSVMLAAFAGIALLLASIGVFGVMSHAVGQRTRELGIRKALGASSAQVRSMVLREGMQLVLTGVVLGLAAAVAINTVLAKLLASVLYDIDALDPWTFVLVPLVIIAIGVLACWLPARKATRVDPMLAMRSD